MVIADVTATGDDNILSAQANELAFRKEQLKRLQEEVLDLEDLKTGVSITDMGLNDFRMDLVHFVKHNGDLASVPKGMHAVIPADPARDLVPGAVFVLRNANQDVNIDQLNRLHPYYILYVHLDGEVHIRHTEVKRTLDLIRAACKGCAEPIPELCRPFNRETRDGRKMDAYSHLLKQAIHSVVAVKEEGDLQSLFSAGGTTALLNAISGLDDFELIAFLIVRERGG